MSQKVYSFSKTLLIIILNLALFGKATAPVAEIISASCAAMWIVMAVFEIAVMKYLK